MTDETCQLCDLVEEARTEHSNWNFRITQMQIELRAGHHEDAIKAEERARASFDKMVTAVRKHSELAAAGVKHVDTGNLFEQMISGKDTPIEFH